MKILKAFNSILFPAKDRCFFCSEKDFKIVNFICGDCRKNLEYLNREVNLKNSYLHRLVYSLFYNRFIQEKIYAYKYHNKNYLYKPLAEILLGTIREKSLKEEVDIITHVPLHRRRKALRGYDQSKLISKYVSKELGLPFSSGNLIRKRATKSQARLTRRKRMENLKAAFYVKEGEEFSNKKILLIDDIITTGATMEECSKELVRVGAKKVIGLAITSGMKI